MYEVRIPEEVYQQAMQKAQADHVSLEQFVTEAVQLRLQTEDAAIQRMFTPERLAHIAKAQDEIKAGQGIPFEQWRADFQIQRAERLKNLEQ